MLRCCLGLINVIVVCTRVAADDIPSDCRAFRFVGCSQEHLEAREFVGAPTTKAEQMEVYVTLRPDGRVYMHSNLRSRVPKDTVDVLNLALAAGKANLVRMLYTQVDGEWYFEQPTKVVSDPKEKAIALALYTLVYADLPENWEERKRSFLAVYAKARIYINRKALACKAIPSINVLPGVVVVDVPPSRVGVVSDVQKLPGWKQEYKTALKYLDVGTTTDGKKAAFYVTRKDGTLYIQSNFRPVAADGMLAQFPAKIATKHERNLAFLVGVMLCDRSRSRDDDCDTNIDKVWRDLRFYVDRQVRQELDFMDSPNVTEVSSPSSD